MSKSIFDQLRQALDKGFSGLAKDIGEKIMLEFNEKEGDITDYDKSVALQYFAEDYVNYQRLAKYHFDSASSFKTDSPEHGQALEKTLEFTRRAKKDFELSLEISPLTDGFLHNRPRSLIDNEVNEWETKVSLARKYPSCYNIIIPYHFRMQQAIQEDNFEIAKEMRDNILSITTRYKKKN